jgi:5-(carboxyamino)imidazole ribonucleotide mutase
MENPQFNVFLAISSDDEKAILEHSAKTLYDFGIATQWRKVNPDPRSIAALADELEAQSSAVVIATGKPGVNLPAALASLLTLPVLGVPVEQPALKGTALDSILSTVNAGGTNGVASLAIGKAGAINAALQAVAIASLSNGKLREKLEQFRAEQTAKVLSEKLPV